VKIVGFFTHYNEITTGVKSSEKARVLVVLTEKLTIYKTLTLERPVVGFVLYVKDS
jgi:hypothetical protein